MSQLYLVHQRGGQAPHFTWDLPFYSILWSFRMVSVAFCTDFQVAHSCEVLTFTAQKDGSWRMTRIPAQQVGKAPSINSSRL